MLPQFLISELHVLEDFYLVVNFRVINMEDVLNKFLSNDVDVMEWTEKLNEMCRKLETICELVEILLSPSIIPLDKW